MKCHKPWGSWTLSIKKGHKAKAKLIKEGLGKTIWSLWNNSIIVVILDALENLVLNQEAVLGVHGAIIE